MYQEGWHPKRRGRGPEQAGIRVAGCSSHCARARASSPARLHSGQTRTVHTGEAGVSVYVFTGPTISPAEARAELEAVYLPPAAEGDVFRAALKRPQAIGIIDGYFQSTPSVRHKEILWAMSRGIHVFGSASIGALRAAELAAFGMEGVGTVFELYRDGVLEDDDEVAIAHGPAEVEFRGGSEAMVDIRQTLQRAERVGVISIQVRTALERIAKE